MTIYSISREALRKHQWGSISHTDSIERASQVLKTKIVSFLTGWTK